MTDPLKIGIEKLGRGDLPGAIVSLQKAIDAGAGFEALLNMGVACMRLGDIEAAEAFLYDATRAKPGIAQPWMALVNLQTYNLGSPIYQRLKYAMERAKEGEKPGFYFALGKICDDFQIYDRAWHYYEQANMLSKTNFEIKKSAADMATSSMQALSDLVALSESNTSESKQEPVFIVGMPRSGSTLLENALDQHSALVGLGERREIGRMRALLSANPKTDISVFSAAYERILNEFEPQRCIDKQPLNALHIPFILKMFPRAKFIYLKRNRLDTVVSNFFQPFVGLAFTYNLKTLASCTSLIETMMDIMVESRPDSIYTLQYEEFIQDSDFLIRDVLGFLDLEYERSCSRPHENLRDVLTPSMLQVKRPINSFSVNRWENYKTQLAPAIQIFLQEDINAAQIQESLER